MAVGGSLIGQLAVIYFPPLQRVFQTEALYFTGKCLILSPQFIISHTSILIFDRLMNNSDKYLLFLFRHTVPGLSHLDRVCGI